MMRTARSLTVSCNICHARPPLPCTPPAMNALPPCTLLPCTPLLPCMSPATHAPTTHTFCHTHTPCHARPLPHTSHHARPLPCTPSVTDRCKNITLPQTLFAGGKNCYGFIVFVLVNLSLIHQTSRESIG